MTEEKYQEGLEKISDEERKLVEQLIKPFSRVAPLRGGEKGWSNTELEKFYELHKRLEGLSEERNKLAEDVDRR